MSSSLHYGLALITLTRLALGHIKGPPPSPAEIAAEERAEAQNRMKMKHTLIIFAAMAISIAIYRVIIYSVRYIRTLACLNNATQKYFKTPSPKFARFKYHILYAPLFRQRHRREFRLFNMSLGILPSRIQSLFLAGIIAMNVAHCVRKIPWDGPHTVMLSQLRNRTGNLAIVNMIPLIIMAGRNNPLIAALDVTFDNFNLIHRFFGRMVVVQAVVHSVAHLMIMVPKGLFSSTP